MESTDEESMQFERPREVVRAVQFLFAAIVIGLITAIVNLAQHVSGAPMIFALLLVIAFFGIGFVLILRIAATRWMKIIKSVLLTLSAAFAVVALGVLI